MPQSLDAGDRKLLIGAGIMLIILVVVSTIIKPPEITGGAGFPSSYSPAWDGAKGAYMLLVDMGYHVERWEKSPTEIGNDPRNMVLILAQPIQPPTEQERYAIRNFLSEGGRILATGANAARFLPDATQFEEGNSMEDEDHFPALLPSPLMRGAPEITMTAPTSWHPESPRQLVVYGNTDTAAVVTFQFGKGQVIWFAAATPLTNGGIRDQGNLALFLNCLGPPGRQRILWDEYFHGAQGSLWSYFARTPVLWGIAQSVLVFLAILATFSRRRGPIRVPVTPSRLSPLEFVETLGDLYHSANAGSTAVRTAYNRLRFLLIRQLGLHSNISVPDLAHSASQHLIWKQEPLFDTLSRSERAMRRIDLRSDEALKLVQEIFDYTGRLALKRSSQHEGQMK